MYGPKLFIFFDLLSISMSVLTLLSCNLAMGKLMKLKVLSDLYVYLSTSLNWMTSTSSFNSVSLYGGTGSSLISASFRAYFWCRMLFLRFACVKAV